MGIEAFEKLSPEKQNSILQAGILEFSQKSFPDASTDTITQHAGFRKGFCFTTWTLRVLLPGLPALRAGSVDRTNARSNTKRLLQCFVLYDG